MIRRKKIDKVIAKNIYRILKQRNASASDLAKKVKMSRQLLAHKLREGRFYYSDVEEIANALGVSVSYLAVGKL
jgi:transcriptional regulator with XRE-family HTH domain